MLLSEASQFIVAEKCNIQVNYPSAAMLLRPYLLMLFQKFQVVAPHSYNDFCNIRFET